MFTTYIGQNKEPNMNDTDQIRGYHAHVYFDASTRDVAVTLREAIGARFNVELGRVVDRPYGPHPQPMYQLAFGTDELAKIVPWLMLNRRGLNILVHPRTGDELSDHATNPMWLGTPVPLDLDFIRRYVAAKAS
jgi:aromatic ring-cleaving dioxygenase